MASFHLGNVLYLKCKSFFYKMFPRLRKESYKIMANTKIEFLVSAPVKDELYLVGNIPALGEWNAAKGVKLTYCAECGRYTASKLLPADANVEFKVLAGKTWDAVEKGAWGEDVANHAFVAAKGTKVEVEVLNF